jgi:hypothetical protein
MKRHLSVLSTLVFICFASGCAGIAPGHDPVVVNAERATVLALDTVDTFLAWEFQNREAFASVPEIRESANYLRRNAPAWFETARDLTKSYKQNRTEQNKANLGTVIAILQRATRQANAYLPAALKKK